LRPFFDELFNAYAIDTNQDVAMESGTAQARIKARAEELSQEFGARYTKEKYDHNRRVSYDTAIHLHFERPEGLKFPITRDTDAWKQPEDLLWSEKELQDAQSREQWREAKQEQLRKINEKVRSEMLGTEQAKPQTQAAPDVEVVEVVAK
jgi:hypothetical protein